MTKGNRTGVWRNGTRTVTQTVNAANQIADFSYDASGNLTSDGTATSTAKPPAAAARGFAHTQDRAAISYMESNRSKNDR